MKKIVVNTKAQLDELYNDSALSFEGMNTDSKNLQAIKNWIEQYTGFVNEAVYVVSGSMMNLAYGLTGANAYPEKDCDIVCIKLSDLKEPMALAFPRFAVGGRWFDDIVDNNARREKEA